MPKSITVVLEDGRIFTTTGFEEIHAPDIFDLNNGEKVLPVTE